MRWAHGGFRLRKVMSATSVARAPANFCSFVRRAARAPVAEDRP
jgi:hypothetical protein